jgi:pyridoxamine 5'-phosphate oxidase
MSDFTTDTALAAMRSDYSRERLRREDLHAESIAQFEAWLDDAFRTQLTAPNAMSLATVGTDGQPLLRTILLKGLDARGLVFFTNLESRKARPIAENSHVSLLFPWLPLERQVVVTGTAAKLPATESMKYFLARPRDSQLAAWASRQSSVISSRKVLAME